MIPFLMIMIDEFFEGPPEMALTERHDPIQALVFNRPYEPLSVRVPIGSLKRRQHDLYPGIAQLPSHLPGSTFDHGHR